MIAALKNFFKENSLLNLFVLFLILLIPLAWSRYLNANYVSAKLFLLFSVSSLSLLISFKKITIPKLNKAWWLLMGVIVILHLLSPVISQKWTDLFYLAKFFSFCALANYFYTLRMGDLENIMRKMTYALFVVISLIMVFAAKDFYKVRIEDMSIVSGYLLGSFGNVNMMTEFLILTIPLVFYWLGFKDRVPYLIKFVLFVTWIFFILYCRSRSAWIGLILWTAWELFKGGRRKELLMALPIALVCYSIAINTPSNVVGVDFKQDSLKERINLYKATVGLIKDSPLGNGVGHFDSYLVPYQVGTEVPPSEYLHYDQPHSEILRWAAQLGWLGITLAIALILMAAWTVFLSKSKDLVPKNSINRNFLIATFMVLAPQMLFQFPYHNPASILYLSFIFALFVSLFTVQKEILVNWKKRIPIFIIAFIGVVHAVAFVTSIFYESTESDNPESVTFACSIYPTNQNACFLKTYYLLKNSKLPEARLEMIEGFNSFSYHRGLLRVLPTYLKYTAGDKRSCEAVWMYNTLFPKQKFFDEQVLKSCGAFSAPVVFQNPQQFNKDYLYWLNRQLQ